MLEINTQSSIKIEGIYFDPFKIKEESAKGTKAAS